MCPKNSMMPQRHGGWVCRLVLWVYSSEGCLPVRTRMLCVCIVCACVVRSDNTSIGSAVAGSLHQVRNHSEEGCKHFWVSSDCLNIICISSMVISEAEAVSKLLVRDEVFPKRFFLMFCCHRGIPTDTNQGLLSSLIG